MVVKTEVCSYSGFRIYPGHGIKYVRGDSKSFLFINRKSKSYFHQKFNPRKIAWTLLYRRMHKKGTLEEANRKKTRKVNKATQYCDQQHLPGPLRRAVVLAMPAAVVVLPGCHSATTLAARPCTRHSKFHPDQEWVPNKKIELTMTPL